MIKKIRNRALPAPTMIFKIPAVVDFQVLLTLASIRAPSVFNIRLGFLFSLYSFKILKFITNFSSSKVGVAEAPIIPRLPCGKSVFSSLIPGNLSLLFNISVKPFL